MRDLTFAEVCRFIKEDEPSLIGAANSLLSVGLLLSPIAFGLSIADIEPALGLLALKSELIKLGKTLFEKLTTKDDSDPVVKHERMLAAYGLLCYTSYFDTLDRQLPEVKRLLGINAADRLALSTAAADRLQRQADVCAEPDGVDRLGLCAVRLPVPHPAETFDRVLARLRPLHLELTKGLTRLLEALAAWESSTDEKRKEILQLLQQVPQKATARFEAQYYALSSRYHDFYVWANLHEHASTHTNLDRLSDEFRGFVARFSAYREHIDLGFGELSQLIAHVPTAIESHRATNVFTELERNYVASIEEPIIKDPSASDSNRPTLSYPRKADIFIPQSFKVLRYVSGQQLEDESAWNAAPVRKDLGQFLVAYLSSPYSTRAPLIILGHPGCGKSLLSQMLAAKFVSNSYTPIRVELRSIEADNELEVQIEEQIRKDTGRTITFATLTEHLDNRPALIIFDGYDELLQASGQVFASYIMKVQKFQEREAKILQRNPLRAIVTSRLTLINKALVPTDATVVRLLEFDKDQQTKWISVWNSTNSAYFEQTGTQSFQLPADDDKLRPLAEQPLLLLMLALYDSSGNQLRTNRGLDQTLLYESLLRQFIEREHLKSAEFRSLNYYQRTSEIDTDLERLGVAAIGMFNRRSLSIRTNQLDADLAFLRLERAVPVGPGRALSQAELLLGSFFFVHKSKAEHKGDHAHDREADVAFEFLHNTFGEFLAGEFIIRRLLRETTKLAKLRQDRDLLVHRERVINDAEGLPEDWFASLMYAPFFLRPVVLEMMREWFRHRLKAAKKDAKECMADFEDIVRSHIKRFLLDRTFPSVMTHSGKTSFGDLPLQGYVAIYTLNLITLAVVLSPDEFIFDEQIGSPLEERARIWDRLGHLWQAWFAPDTLSGLSAIFIARREGSRVILKARESFRTNPVRERLDVVLNVGFALGDDTLVSLAGLARNELFRKPAIEAGELRRRAEAAGLRLNVEILIKRIRLFAWGFRSPEERVELLRECEEAIRESETSDIGLIVDLLRTAQAVGESRLYVPLAAELADRVARMEWSARHGLQWFTLLSRMFREWPLWGLPYHVLEQVSANEIEVVASLPNPDVALEVLRFGSRFGRAMLSPETLKQFVERFDDVSYVASSSPEAVVDFLRSSASGRPPLQRVGEHLMNYFISARQLFSMAPETAADLLSIAQKRRFRELCGRFCGELESLDWLHGEEGWFVGHRLRRMSRHDLGIIAFAGRSVRLLEVVLRTVLSHGSARLQEQVLRELLERPRAADTAIGVMVLKLARVLGQGEMLMSALREMGRHLNPSEQLSAQRVAQAFLRVFRVDIEAVPISAAEDLRWFARLCDGERAAAQIERAVGSAAVLEAPSLFSGDE